MPKTVILVGKIGPAFSGAPFRDYLGSRWVLHLDAIECGMKKELIDGRVKVTKFWRWDRSAG